MIAGVVAQEKLQPFGVFSPPPFADNDNVFGSVITSGLDQRLFPGAIPDDDDVLPQDLPQVLTSDAVKHDWSDPEYVFSPFVARGQRLVWLLYTDPDGIFRPDIRVPGALLPQVVGSDDLIFPTPLILDPGMLRAVAMHIDPDVVGQPIVYAALGLFPQRLPSDDDIKPTVARGGVVAGHFVLSDDMIFNFTSTTGGNIAAFVIDDALPAQIPPSLDGPSTGVTLSNNNLTAAHANEDNYCGARSTLFKTSGKYYFEVAVGATHGIVDCVGVMHEDATYFNVGNFSNLNTCAYSQYDRGPVAFDFTRYGSLETWIGGDVIGAAIDLNNKRAWFRRNNGPWNGDLNGVPEAVGGGAPVALGRMSPMIGFGGQAGRPGSGQPGDNMTIRFYPPFAVPPPIDFINWITESPFGPAINGDSFGPAIVGLPTTFDGPTSVNVSLTNGNRTATHLTTGTDSGARSVAAQRYGKYYFEVTVGATHGKSDCIGILIDGFDFGNAVSQGSACLVVHSDGTLAGAVSGAAGAVVLNGGFGPGNIIGVAVDLTGQTQFEGGQIWFRKGNTWNNDVTADPVARAGGLKLAGFNNIQAWVPLVGFGGNGTAVGDSFTANFGQSTFAAKAPSGFAVWSTLYNNYIQGLASQLVSDDLDEEDIPGSSADLGDKVLSHPSDYFHDEAIENIFRASSFGGNLLVAPNTVVNDAIDIEAVYPGANLAKFDSSSPTVALSNGDLTATTTAALAYVGARSRAQQIVGKYYFEALYAVKSNWNEVGILKESATYVDAGSSSIGGTFVSSNTSGTIFANNTNSGRSFGAIVSGDLFGIAVNLNIRRAWFRKNNGLWNNITGHDPANDTGGVVIESLASFSPFVTFSSGLGDSFVLNFGKTAYVNPAPPNYGNWPGTTTSQYLSTGPVLPDDDSIKPTRVSPANLFGGFVDDKAITENVFLISSGGGSPTLGPQQLIQDDVDTEQIFPTTMSNVLAVFDGAASAVTLSTDKLTATHNSTANNAGVRSNSVKLGGGKFYFEVTMTNVHGDSDSCGLITASGTFSNFVTTGSQCLAIYRWNGAIYSNNGSSGQALGACVAGDVIGVAVDLTARKAWMRKSGGLWNGVALAQQNPNTGVGGVALHPSAPYAPAIGFGGANTAINDSMIANFGNAAFANAAPTGFGRWSATPPIPITMDGDLVINATLSTDKLTVTHNATATGGACSGYGRGTSVAAKYYWEATIGPTHGAGDCVGVQQDALTQFNNLMAGSSNTAPIYLSTGQIWASGANSGKALGVIVQGDVIGMAFEFGVTARCWFRKNGGLWNNDATANPATGTGGIAVSANNAMAPVAGFGGTGTAAGDSVTMNFGATTYLNAAPAGFLNWMTV